MPPLMTNPAPDVRSVLCNAYFVILVSFFPWYSIHYNIINTNVYCYSFFSEQGRRNDLSKPPSDGVICLKLPPCNSAVVSTKINPTDKHSLSPPVNVISDSVHCNPLRQSSVSSGFSCHIDDNLSDELDDVPSVGQNHPSSHPSWVHVFSKSTSTTPLRTQCAAAANLFVKSPKVLHRRSRRAKKKQRNTEQLLREVTVPPNQFTMTCKQIESKIIVFDGGKPTPH